MFTWFNDLLTSTSGFMPHGACYLWLPSLLWLHIISDTLIALAYYSIPFALLYFVKKRTDMAYRWVFVLFGVFILLCGTTHLISIWTIWYPDYWLAGWVKLATALVSIITALLVWPLIPKLLLLPSPQALQTSKAYLRAIFDATPDAMLISNEQGAITMANKQAQCLLGYSVDELLGLSIEDLVPQRFRDAHPALRARFAAASVARPMGAGRMVKALRKDGSELDVEISLSPIQTAQGLFFASALRDITERKCAEASLRASEARFRRMANSSPIMIWITDAIGNPTFVNQSWLDFTGLDSVQTTHDDWVSSIHPDDRKTAFLAYYQDTEAHVAITTEYRLCNAKGEWRWILDKGTPLYDEDGTFNGYIGSAIDITESKQAQQLLQDKERMLSESQRIAHIGSWSVDLATGFASWSDEMYQIYGVNQQDFVPSIEAVLELIYPDDRVAAKKWMRDCCTGKGVQEMDFRIKLADGTVRFIRGSGGLQCDEMGKPLYMVGCSQDITERKQIELDQRIAAVAFESQEPIVITDTESIILRINQAFTESTGYSEAEAVGQKISLLKSGRHDADFYAAMWESIDSTGAWQGEIWDRRKNGEVYPKWLSITAVKSSDGVVSHFVGTHSDITERKTAEEQIKQLAFYDPLTQLPNRRLLQERLKHGINVERREGRQLGLLMLDLDRFKAVNDSLGHLAGDELLLQVAARISARTRDVDLVARLGGDEFVVLLEDIAQPEDAARIAEEIITELSRPFCLPQNDNVLIGASIGISLYPQHGDTPEALMDHADAALYQAKDAGRGCFAYFSEDLTLAARERIELETRLRRAIGQHELRVFYQAQVDIASGRIVGAEALVRWQDPVEGLISPLRFIPIAEETGLILPLGEWVLRETCRQGRAWLDAGLPPLTLAVNVSAYQLRRSDICTLVAEVLHETGFPAKQLELEITESGLMENQDNATQILNCLRSLGIRLAIDDFGTGYSSLAYLKHFPLDLLKIDKRFIDDIPHMQDDMEITATIISMGHILGFKVLAEGVETDEQLAFLQEKGCDMYQGYIKSKPLPGDEFVGLLRGQQPFLDYEAEIKKH
ncbi:MAG: PAS domain S-box protein [Methylobacter sp.]|nr:PAS domain S-box protein [Methylobacter sp.]MDP2099235.1 PAS domain S-box protein [Methylobacter sp.]MDP2426618.1 PAS domain S-box protein [Methylobacter sp.]MDP3055436.1 PAS domain S-box protein [Methylobacter sp.]MDP3364296.1 PAS domain S-box protein [Methylobacter sp.]